MIIAIDEIPEICWEFDKILFRPVQMRFLGINESDSWMRFEYVDITSSNSEFVSFPQSDWNAAVFPTRLDCLSAVLSRLSEQMKYPVGTGNNRIDCL